MIIIFNRDAVSVALYGIIFLIPVGILRWFDILDYDQALLIGSWVLFAASLYASASGLKGRFFYIFPTWTVTFSLAVYSSLYFLDELVTIVKIIGLAIIVLIILMFIFLFIEEKRRIRDLSQKEILLPDLSNGTLNYWRAMRDLVFIPFFSNWTEDICAYNIRVIQFLKENKVELEYADQFLNELVATRDKILSGVNHQPDREIQSSFFSQIDQQIKLWRLGQ